MCLIFGYVDTDKTNVLWIMCRFALAEGKLMKPLKGRYQFLHSG